MKVLNKHAVFGAALALCLLGPPAWAGALLGSASQFGVLAGAAVTNTGSSTVQGDLGLHGSAALGGLSDVVVLGTLHGADNRTKMASDDALTAFNTLAGLAFTADLSGQDLGSVGTLLPGIYRFDSLAQLSGTLTLDAQHDPQAMFIFQIGSDLVTASGAHIEVLNGVPGQGVYWQVGNSASLGAGSVFAGNILAGTGISLDADAKILCGRALALHAGVRLNGNVISNDCESLSGGGHSDFGSAGFSGSFLPLQLIPEPAALAAFGLLGVALSRRAVRRRRQAPLHAESSR